MQQVLVEMQLLGKFGIAINGREIVWKTKRVGKVWNVLCLLAAHSDSWLSTREIAQSLWEGKEAEKTRNDVKSAISQLRRELAEKTGLERSSIIEYSKGGYRLGAQVAVQADFQQVNQVLRQLEGRLPDHRRLSLCRRLARLYTGAFYHGDGCGQWMEPYSAAMDSAFLAQMGQCFRQLWQAERHEEAVALYRLTQKAHPFCREMTVYYYRTLYAMGRKEEILQDYAQREQEFWSGAEEPEVMGEIRNIVLLAQQRSGGTSAGLLDEVKSQISPRQMQRAQVVSYRQLRNIWLENPGRYAVATFTLKAAQEPEENAEALHQAMEELKALAQGSLRGHDIISPYSDNQMLVVLPNHSLGTGQLVRDRLYQSLLERVDTSRILVSAEARAF